MCTLIAHRCHSEFRSNLQGVRSLSERSPSRRVLSGATEPPALSSANPSRAFCSCALACLGERQRPTSHPCIGATPGSDRTIDGCDLPLSTFQAGRALSGATVPLALSGAVPSGSLREGTRTHCALRCLPPGMHRHEGCVSMSRESFPTRVKGASRRASRAVQARELLAAAALLRALESLPVHVCTDTLARLCT